MFGLVFVSDGQNEGPLIMALILIAQLAFLLCGIVSVCYTCTCGLKSSPKGDVYTLISCMWDDKGL